MLSTATSLHQERRTLFPWVTRLPSRIAPTVIRRFPSLGRRDRILSHVACQRGGTLWSRGRTSILHPMIIRSIFCLARPCLVSGAA